MLGGYEAWPVGSKQEEAAAAPVGIVGVVGPAPEQQDRRLVSTKSGQRLQPGTASEEEVFERAYRLLYSHIWEASRDVANLEPEFSHQELARRVAKYFYKAARAPELLAMPWEQAARQFVDHAMQGYSTAYSERPWFFELELGQTVCAGLWELLRSSRADPCRNSQAMERVVIARYESSMDTLILEKAMWDATMATFPDQAVGPKVYKALLRVRAAALEKAMPAGARDCKAGRGGKGRMLSDRRRQEALEKVENFLKEWMESAMSRAWQAVDHSDSLITEVSVLRLFQSLVAPFGEDHPFSCVPADLTEAIGRPPHDWPFLRKAVRAMFASWRRVAPGNPKRRKKGAAAASAASAASPAFAAFHGCGNGNNGELPPLGASALTARAAAAAVVKQEVKDESGGGADG